MPVIGKVIGTESPRSVMRMKVGDEMFIHADDVTVTPGQIFIDIYAEVADPEYVEEEINENVRENFIPIKRIGEGLTQDDFNLDLSGLPEDFIFTVEAPGYYLDLVKNQIATFIVFEGFEFEHASSLAHNTIAELEEKLASAEDEQDYESAAKLRDEISRKQQKDKKKG